MTALSDRLIAFVLDREGGFSDHPADRGGPTNMGITLKTYSAFLGRPAGLGELRALTRAEAVRVYETLFYRPLRLDRFQQYPRLALIIFDQAVNNGQGDAVKLLQRVLNNSFGENLPLTGNLGIKTETAIYTKDPGRLADALIAETRRFYEKIAEKDPSQKVFLKGWLNRTNEYERELYT